MKIEVYFGLMLLVDIGISFLCFIDVSLMLC